MPDRGKWLALGPDNKSNDRHVMPLNDLRGHVAFRNCACGPWVEDNVVVHNSYDGREIFERAAEAARTGAN